MANLWAAACAGVIPLAVMVTTRELGATAPVLEIVNSHAARFSPDEDVISIGGHTSAVPLKVTPGVVEVSCSVIALSVRARLPTWFAGGDAAAAPIKTSARPSVRSGVASFRTMFLPLRRLPPGTPGARSGPGASLPAACGRELVGCGYCIRLQARMPVPVAVMVGCPMSVAVTVIGWS